MSYITFSSTATCEVAKDFVLHDYLETLSEYIVQNIDDLLDDLRFEFGECDSEEVNKTLQYYFGMSDGKLLIQMDSEENNCNSGVYDWLCDKIRNDVMTSKFMKINHATFDTRYGNDGGTSYYCKDGRFIGSDDIEKVLEQYLMMAE